MAARPQSPRALTPQERAERDAGYRVTAQQFGDILKVLVDVFTSLVTLNTALMGAGQGYALAITVDDGSSMIFTRRHLRSANAQFGARIRQLKRYFQISMRKTKEVVPPSSFSGVYAPVYAGAALRAFFNARPGQALFGGVNIQGQNLSLIDQLVNAKGGFLMRNTTTLLFFAYAHQQGLLERTNGQLARSDAVMDEVFGGAIPAAAFPRFLGDKTVKAKKVGEADRVKKTYEAVSMSSAVQQRLVTGPLNTYEALRVAYPNFSPQSFMTFFFQNMASYNYYTRNMLAVPNVVVDPTFTTDGIVAGQLGADEIVASFDDPAMRAAMLQEHDLAMAASADWKLRNEPQQKADRADRKKKSDAEKRMAGKLAGAQARPQAVLQPLGR